ncbi:glutaredoxin family protein [Cellulomonas sp. DKR-3]|uniref:Glutaredoxin family protein n=1 Tax=Cellulomonas fulva TaxID=2835530 RepID=A0ABS5TYK7_9CELL|nr:glutaredoxin family protein [Cellulomonas fulva]MBT0994216.1 glutaredoxin family protein [Cellulomonas fulva]
MLDDDAPRVVLFSRAGCHLCDAARAVVQDEAARAGAQWREVDVDTDTLPGRDLGEYGELVPVVEVDGVRQGYWQIDPQRLRRALAAG